MDLFAGLLCLLFGATHLAPLYGPLAYVRYEKLHRPAWQAFELAPITLEGSPYRVGGPVAAGHLERAPLVVRVAAGSCFVFGAMFWPGLAWALFGLIAAGMGLLGIPGLILAGWLWRVGRGLLEGTREGAASGARAATFSLYFNVLLAGATTAVIAAAPSADIVPVAVFTLVYALLSVAQALLVVRAARVVAAQHGEPFVGLVEDHLPFFLRRRAARRNTPATEGC